MQQADVVPRVISLAIQPHMLMLCELAKQRLVVLKQAILPLGGLIIGPADMAKETLLVPPSAA